MDAIKRIEQVWEEDFRESYENRFRETAEFSNGRYTFKVIFDPGRDKAHKGRKKDNNGCPFDRTEQLYRCVKGGALYYAVNIYPYFERHFIAFPLEHRESASKQDLDELIELQKHTDNIILMNMRGAGANISEHIHYQCISAELPIYRQEGREAASNQHLKIEIVDFPTFALRFFWNSEQGRNQAEALILGYNRPFNLHIYRDRLFMIPRTGSYSSAAPNTKIGCTEVGGLFVISSEEVFRSLDYSYLESIIRDTTITDEGEIARTKEYFKSGAAK